MPHAYEVIAGRTKLQHATNDADNGLRADANMSLVALPWTRMRAQVAHLLCETVPQGDERVGLLGVR